MVIHGLESAVDSGEEVGHVGEYFSQVFFEDCPPRFDVVKIGRIGWKEDELAACRLNQRAGFWTLVEACIVDDDGVTWWQFGQQACFEPLVKNIGIGVAFER